MRRGFSLTPADAVDIRALSRGDNDRELLSFHSAPSLNSAQPFRAASVLGLPPRSLSAGHADALPTLLPAQSPLLDRQRSTPSANDVPSYSAASRLSPGTTLSAAAAASGASPHTFVFPAASPFAPLVYPFSQSQAAGERNPSVTSQGEGFGRLRETSVASTQLSGVLRPGLDGAGPNSFLQAHGNGGSAVLPHTFTAGTSPPPSEVSPSSWRTVRLVLCAFCLLNSFLAFLFAWMMRTRQTAFAVVSVRLHWDLDERAAPVQRAGVYYAVLGFILLVNRASAAVLILLRAAACVVRAGCSKGRRAVRRGVSRAITHPVFAPLLRLWAPKANDDEAALLLGADGAAGAAWAAPPAPLKIRRRGT